MSGNEIDRIEYCESDSHEKKITQENHSHEGHTHDANDHDEPEKGLLPLSTSNWSGSLQPYLCIEEVDINGEDYISLYIYFKKDSHNQKISLTQHKKPGNGVNMRLIRLYAEHVAKVPGDYYYRGQIYIKVSDRGPAENRIRVHIDHVHTPHGGTGVIHWP